MRTAARELATLGAEAYEQKDFRLAYDRLTRAFALYPVPSISIMQARSLQQLGQFVDALDRFEETRRMPLAEDAPEAFRVAVRDAAAEGEQLRTRIPRLFIQVSRGGVATTDVAVTIDGRVLPDVLLNVDCPVDPGEHVVVVKAKAAVSVTRQVKILEKERVVLDISLDVAAPLPTPSWELMSPVASSPPPSNTRKWWGWGAVGGGAAALLGAAITGKVALGKQSSLDRKCDPGCPVGSEGEIDAFRTYRTASYVTASASVVLVGVGGYLLLTQGSSGAKTAVSVGGNGVTLSGRF
jgi:hypothetical protein